MKALTLPALPLRLRLTLWVVLVSLLVQAASGLGVLLYLRTSIGRLSDGRIRARADFIAGEMKRAGFKATDEDLGRMAEDSFKDVLLDASVVTLYSGTGEPLASSLRPAPSPAQLQLVQPKAGPTAVVLSSGAADLGAPSGPHLKARTVLQRMVSEDGREYILLLAATDTYYETMILAITRALLILAPIVTLASAAGAWVVVGKALAPLDHLRRITGSFAPTAIEDELELPLSSSPEIRAIEESLRRARAQFRAALQSQNRFISSITHELNTPIAVLLVEAQTLNRQDLPPAAEKFVGSVTDEMRHLGRIVESFLILTRLQCGRPLLRFRPCGVNDFVMDAVENCAKLAAESGITLTPSLARGDKPLLVSGESDLLSVMVDSLVRNAIRFSNGRRQVMIAVEDRGENCELTVRDFGKGCPEEVLASLSQRFVQPSDQSIAGRGHAVGLSIAQSIAELHGGRIAVRNADKDGCEFSITLPLTVNNGALPAPASV